MNAFFYLAEAEFQTACDRNHAKIEPFLQNGFQIFLRRAIVEPHHHQIHRHIALKAGLRHQRVDEVFRLDAARFRLKHKPHGRLAVALVAHFFD